MSTDNNPVDIVIPDIGDTENVEVIELLVGTGDEVALDDSLLTLESDKASMEVPATSAGVIESLTVSVGDTVNAGDVIGTMKVNSDGAESDDDTENDTENAEKNADDKSNASKDDAGKQADSGGGGGGGSDKDADKDKDKTRIKLKALTRIKTAATPGCSD